jgi:hypothetical protein
VLSDGGGGPHQGSTEVVVHTRALCDEKTCEDGTKRTVPAHEGFQVIPGSRVGAVAGHEMTMDDAAPRSVSAERNWERCCAAEGQGVGRPLRSLPEEAEAW